MSERVEAVVVGAGVVGLAVARALVQQGREVVVIEAAPTFGTHASSRNSEVIHAGIYYPPGSRKARWCLEGKRRLYAYCEEHDIGHARTGKLIVATDSTQTPALHRIAANARACGVADLEPLDRRGVRALEPAVEAVAGLWSPSTGIVDSHRFMCALLADARAGGAMVAFSTVVHRVRRIDRGFEIQAGAQTVACDRLVNAAGLGAQALAQVIEGLDPDSIPRRHLAKGTYAALRGPHPFSHLVYPIPASASLGIHLTLDLDGGARFGPDQQWIDEVDYALDPSRLSAFYPAVRRYWPDLPDDALQPDYAGIRSKVQAPGTPMADFVVHGPAEHGIEGLVNLYGIESPGLTASLALADDIVRTLASPE